MLSQQTNHAYVHQSTSLLEYLEELVSRRSVTPEDAGCQTWIANRLERLGFQCEIWQINGVSNMIARLGNGPVRVAFSGHTDVVPAGNEASWRFPPFQTNEFENMIYGRGIADMKGSIAAMMVAIENQVAQFQTDKYSFYVILTSDEEGEAQFGTQHIIETLRKRDELPHFCLIGEPTSDEVCGDVIKIGRRGAISGRISVSGKQGHVAYPRYADNALHKASRITHALTLMDWDSGTSDFPGTTLQVTHMDSGEYTDNIIPAEASICFNLRFSHKYDLDTIKQRVSSCLSQLVPAQQFDLTWERYCSPYHYQKTESDDMDLIEMVERAIFSCTQHYPRLSTSGGTSDGRFFANAGCQVVELGLTNKTIHQIDERVSTRELLNLQSIYEAWLKVGVTDSDC